METYSGNNSFDIKLNGEFPPSDIKWTFSDGMEIETTTEESELNRKFCSPGVYTVFCTVPYPGGGTAKKSFVIEDGSSVMMSPDLSYAYWSVNGLDPYVSKSKHGTWFLSYLYDNENNKDYIVVTLIKEPLLGTQADRESLYIDVTGSRTLQNTVDVTHGEIIPLAINTKDDLVFAGDHLGKALFAIRIGDEVNTYVYYVVWFNYELGSIQAGPIAPLLYNSGAQVTYNYSFPSWISKKNGNFEFDFHKTSDLYVYTTDNNTAMSVYEGNLPAGMSSIAYKIGADGGMFTAYINSSGNYHYQYGDNTIVAGSNFTDFPRTIQYKHELGDAIYDLIIDFDGISDVFLSDGLYAFDSRTNSIVYCDFSDGIGNNFAHGGKIGLSALKDYTSFSKLIIGSGPINKTYPVLCCVKFLENGIDVIFLSVEYISARGELVFNLCEPANNINIGSRGYGDWINDIYTAPISIYDNDNSFMLLGKTDYDYTVEKMFFYIPYTKAI